MSKSNIVIKPMRGVKPKGPIQFPVYGSPKIDGLRAIVKGGVVLSKTMKPIPNEAVQKLFGIPRLEGADGEFTVGPARKMFPDDDVYDRSRGPIMRRSGTDVFRFNVFDVWNTPDVEFNVRKGSIYQFGEIAGVRVVDHELLVSQDDLDDYEQRMLGLGYEGVMLRSPYGTYKFGQSTEREGYLLKVKRFEDAEAVIIGVIEQEANLNEATINELGHTRRSSSKAGKVGKGTFGAFVCRDLKTGIEFSVGNGPGLTHAMRDELWAIRDQLPGRFITYTFQGIGTVNAPRLPQFKGFRDPIDMADLSLREPLAA